MINLAKKHAFAVQRKCNEECPHETKRRLLMQGLVGLGLLFTNHARAEWFRLRDAFRAPSEDNAFLVYAVLSPRL